MNENEAIERIKYRMHTAGQVTGESGMEDLEMAIKALEEIQKYRALETRLAEMFGGALCLEIVIDELERQLKEPDNLHPINAKILTYEDAADWDAYRAIGMPEELRTMKEHGGFSGIELAEIAAALTGLKEYQQLGTLEECRAAMEKQTACDPDKVVEQLEEYFNATNDKGARLAYHHAIQIVKGGGVDG